MISEKWWGHELESSICTAVTQVNDAHTKKNEVDIFRGLVEATNSLWTQLNKYQTLHGLLTEARGDAKSFAELLRFGHSNEEKQRIASSIELEKLVDLDPPILNEDILRKGDYDPQAIPLRLKTDASEEHRKVKNTYKKYLSMNDNEQLDSLLKRIAELLYVVRSNIAHGGKTLMVQTSRKLTEIV